MIAFVYCDQRCPEKTNVTWANSATEALTKACRSLKTSAINIEIDRAPSLDGVGTCSEKLLGEYRSVMIAKFPQCNAVKEKITIFTEPQWEVATQPVAKPEPVMAWDPMENLPKWGGNKSHTENKRKPVKKEPAVPAGGDRRPKRERRVKNADVGER